MLATIIRYVILFSKFSYSQAMIDYRQMTCELMPAQCRNEKYYDDEINAQLEERFHIGFRLPICFIDSWAKAINNTDDATQQSHFEMETEKLWEFAQNTDEFQFKTVDEVLEENKQLRDEVDCLNGVIEKNITELQSELLILELSNFVRSR